MSTKARQMPDGHYSFIELRDIWKHGQLTLEECITQMLHAMIRFETRKAQLELKLLLYKPVEEGFETQQSYEALKAQAESSELLQTIKLSQKMLYKAMDFILEQFAVAEFKLIHQEREIEELLRKQDTTLSHLN